MPTAQQDTEITLGTGRMLSVFFAFVLVCACFFAIGFSLGRRTASAGVGSLPSVLTGAPATVVRPSTAAVEGRTTVAGAPVRTLGKLPTPALAVLLPSEKPMAKKQAQTRTNAKKTDSMRPVPSVISVSCCA